jgi:AcrR family transcriptional regulator
MSIGAVYRRFRNKDAVLRAVYRRFFARVRNRNRRALHEAASRQAGTTQLLEAVVRGIAEGYRRHKDLLRPLALYVRTHPDRAFRGRARKLNAAVFADLRPLLMNTQPGIRHPQPEIAVTFAVSAIAAVLQEQILFDDVTSLPPLGDHELICEAARMMRSYLAGCPSKTDAATLESSNVSS